MDRVRCCHDYIVRSLGEALGRTFFPVLARRAAAVQETGSKGHPPPSFTYTGRCASTGREERGGGRGAPVVAVALTSAWFTLRVVIRAHTGHGIGGGPGSWLCGSCARSAPVPLARASSCASASFHCRYGHWPRPQHTRRALGICGIVYPCRWHQRQGTYKTLNLAQEIIQAIIHHGQCRAGKRLCYTGRQLPHLNTLQEPGAGTITAANCAHRGCREVQAEQGLVGASFRSAMENIFALPPYTLVCVKHKMGRLFETI